MTTITLLTGGLVPLPGGGEPSGIAKTPVDGPRYLGLEGFEGDQQGDRKAHGGPEKAVHHYALDHYPGWLAELGQRPALLGAGGFGENISTVGMDEETVAIGDIFRVGGALVQISQGRQPCWKLNRRFDVDDMAYRVQKTGKTGWYYRVLETGLVASGDPMTLVDRVAADWPLRRIWRTFYVDPMNREELQGIVELAALSEGWRIRAARRLERGKVEDWTTRLRGQNWDGSPSSADGTQ